MADWILVPCLVRLRSEFNAIAPGRDKSSDGAVGDAAHQTTQSDHNPDETGNVPIHDADTINEVHAIDVDTDLRTPGLTMEKVVQFVLARCRSGAERRLRYIIYDRRIWSASSGWTQKAYAGANPHDKHAHFSASYTTSLEASIASWHLEDLVALTADELDQIEARAKRAARAAVEEALEADNPKGGGSRDGQQVTTLNRTGYLANAYAPQVLALLAAQQDVSLDPGDVQQLAEAVSAGISDDLATALLSSLAERFPDLLRSLAGRLDPPATVQ